MSGKLKGNRYIINGDTVTGIITNRDGTNYEFIFDLNDFDIVKCYTWRFMSDGYIATSDYKDNYKSLRLHRLIMNPINTLLVDHINHNLLDNRKCNLRIVTNQENQWNQNKTRGDSKFKGVCFDKNAKKWKTAITFNNQKIHLGYFETQEDAAKAYNKKAIELFGNYSNLNKFEEDIA